MRKFLLSGLAIAGLVSAGIGGAVASAETFRLGNLILTLDGAVKPKKLPKKKRAPVKLNVEGHLATDDGTTPPITDRVVVDFDKQGTINTKGLARCDPRKLQNTLTKTAKRKCKDALVGKGHTEALVDFPDQDPFVARGPLLAFNGKPKGGKPVIVFHVFAHVPAPTTFVVPAVISKSPERGFGKRVEVNVPPISGGNGTLTDFKVLIKRNYKVDKRGGKKGRAKKRSYLTARCSKGRFKADATITMRDGRKLHLGIVRPCKGERKRRAHHG